MPRVIVSAGHTTAEPGAEINGLKEVTFTRKIANDLVSSLRKLGIITLAVPYELDLTQRIDWINKTGYSEELGDIAIEIHINDGGKSGIEGWYEKDGNNPSEKLVNSILEKVATQTGLKNQGAKSELLHSLGNLAFVNRIRPIGILLECLYLDNPEDRAFLQDDKKIEQLSDSMAQGIQAFISLAPARIATEKIPETTGRPSVPNNPLFNSAMSGDDEFNFPSFNPAPAGPSPFPSSFGGPTSSFADRDQKRTNIEDMYKLVLGRMPTFTDTNYFLSRNLSDLDLIKKMVESQEHVDLITNARKLPDLEKDIKDLKDKNEGLEVQVKDKDQIVENMNFLLTQKNTSIHNLEEIVSQSNEPSRLAESSKTNPTIENGRNSKEIYYKENFVDKILNFFNEIFG